MRLSHRMPRTSWISASRFFVLETSGVSFTTFQFTKTTFKWWEAYEKSSSVDAPPLSCHEFSVLFLKKFVPQTRREELHRQFEQLCQDGLSVTQYEMSVSSARFNEVVDISRRLEMVSSHKRKEREAKRPHDLGGFSDVPSGGHFQHSRGCPYRPAQMARPVHRGASSGHGSYSARLGQSYHISLPA
ncbi:uncharacterized protein [Nicotiana tomentosiformis]|uniref:uncharacterized protein n=1 Tax=Nicotiana tomentosiformis TaxID=4098 RepID=UPI00388CA3DE